MELSDLIADIDRSMGRVMSALDDVDRIKAVNRARERMGDPLVEEIVKACARELSVPYCAATLLDSAEQVQLASVMPPRIVPAEASYCKYVVATGAPFVVNDTETNPLTALTGPKFISPNVPLLSYLGTPLHGHGELLGALCIADDHTREWSLTEQLALARYSRKITLLF